MELIEGALTALGITLLAFVSVCYVAMAAVVIA